MIFSWIWQFIFLTGLFSLKFLLCWFSFFFRFFRKAFCSRLSAWSKQREFDLQKSPIHVTADAVETLFRGTWKSSWSLSGKNKSKHNVRFPNYDQLSNAFWLGQVSHLHPPRHLLWNRIVRDFCKRGWKANIVLLLLNLEINYAWGKKILIATIFADLASEAN